MKLSERVHTLIDLSERYLQEPPSLPEPMTMPRGGEIAMWIDSTLLRADATVEDVRQLCVDARHYNFVNVCVNPAYVQLAAGLLNDTPVGVVGLVGFPLGASLATYKAFETLANLEAGATEIDMVLNIGALRSQAYAQVLDEIQMVTTIAHNRRAPLKVIIETALLTKHEKVMACLLSKEAGADFIKTSTTFAGGGATLEDVSLIRRVVGREMGVKASGGIRSYKEALAMIQAGANRIGTSAGVTIVEQAQETGA